MRKRKGFTLIELIVAIGILGVVLSFAGLIFRVSIESHRMALANAEIMQKLRVITEQLDADFRGVIIEYGGKVQARTRTYALGDEEIEINSDGIVFFAQGDFQSTRQYDVGGTDETISGNVAAVFYGQPDPNSYDREPEPRNKILLRRQTILASEAAQNDSDPNGEYYATSLETWRVGYPGADLDGWVQAPLIDPNDIEATQPIYLAKGVDNFTISYLEKGDKIGTEALPWKRRTDGEEETADISPYVFKFTFTLYDSRGIIKDGRTFTHIVYVGI